MKRNLTYMILFLSIVFASGGYDNGSSVGKGKFQIDLTWNPFNKINFGQSYIVVSYGVTDKIDIHGYLSNHYENYNTMYLGLFYQFFKSKNIDLATAFGFRKRMDRNNTQIFAPQLLYTLSLTEKIYLGGSFVNVRNNKFNKDYGTSIDIGLFHRLKFKTKRIKEISIGISAFHPTTWKPKTYFLPTYSIDIKFN